MDNFALRGKESFLMWIAGYGGLTLCVATAVFLLAEWFREPGAPAARRPGFFAASIGLMWPLLLLGLMEVFLIAAIQSRSTATARPEGRAPELNRA